MWREVGGQERLAAKFENGRVRFLGFDSAGGIEVLQPVTVMESSACILPALLVAIAVLLLTVIYRPAAAPDPSPLWSNIRIGRARRPGVSPLPRCRHRQPHLSIRMGFDHPDGDVRSGCVRWPNGRMGHAVPDAWTRRSHWRGRGDLECMPGVARKRELVEQVVGVSRLQPRVF